MKKRTLAALTITLLVVLTASIGYGVVNNLGFNPKDPKMGDIKIVNDGLNTYITKNDRENTERLMGYTVDRVSKYALLIMIEFHEDLNIEKLETMKQSSTKRWESLQNYMNKAIAWLSLSKKAENFLGGHLESVLKKELGEK